VQQQLASDVNFFGTRLYKDLQRPASPRSTLTRRDPTSHVTLDDGLIFLSVDDMLFHVHRTTHCALHTVIMGMCPVVHLQDSTEDLACLLKALYGILLLPISAHNFFPTYFAQLKHR